MRIGVITPNFRSEHGWLRQCAASVKQQKVQTLHVLVQDGAELAYGLLPLFDQVIRLPVTLGDTGNTPRAIGTLAAIAQGCDAIAWLDSDNWFLPGHLKSLCDLQEQTGADVCTSGRILYDLAGDPMANCREVDGDRFVDTNCFLLCREAFPLIHVWTTMPRELHPVGDRVFWEHVKRSGLRHVHSAQPTVAYRTNYGCHYEFLKRPAPERAKPQVQINRTAWNEYFGQNS